MEETLEQEYTEKILNSNFWNAPMSPDEKKKTLEYFNNLINSEEFLQQIKQIVNKQGPFVINLFGGPGSGKSTIAAGLFYKLKIRGINCELCTEYAKDMVWEESYHTLDDQIYVFGKQHHRLWRVKDKVDVIICDSPLILSCYYSKTESLYFEKFIVEQFNKFNNVNYFINRSNSYSEVGRMQTIDEARGIDQEIMNILNRHNIKYDVLEQADAINTIYDETIIKLNKKL